MWSDNDIDKAFQRLNPPEPEPTPFPLDAWLRLETELDKAVIERAVRSRLWKFFAAEVAVVALVALGWLLWPTDGAHFAEKETNTTVNSTAAKILPNQLASTKQPAVATAATPAVTTRRTAEKTTNPLAPTASTKASAASSLPESAPAFVAASAATPTIARASSAVITHFPLASGATATRRRRNAAASRLAFQSTATRPKARLAYGRRSTATRPQKTAIGLSAVNTAARLSRSTTTALVKNTDQHPAAGGLAAPTEAPAEAAVADAASSSQLRRESQPLLLSSAAVSPAATPAGEASETNAPVGSTSVSKTAIAFLPPLSAQLSLNAPPERPVLLAPVAEAPSNLPVGVRQPRFYIGLVAAPDLTTVKFEDVERPMLNLGVVLEYRLTSRLRVSTGLLRANKEYYARREDYDWTNYPRAQTRNFSWVDGACTVLDVPLNLRYDALVRPQARLFGSVGLSSFFMQRENYSYDYMENGMSKTWNIPGVVNENRHLFSILNLSFGYERQLGTHWSLQAEPYLKLPLAGVGAGKVRLTSGGVFFGVKYGF